MAIIGLTIVYEVDSGTVSAQWTEQATRGTGAKITVPGEGVRIKAATLPAADNFQKQVRAIIKAEKSIE